MKNLNFRLLLPFVLFNLLFFGCTSEKKESPTKGSAIVFVDDDVYPVIKQQDEKFESLYTDAKVHMIKTSARGAIVQFLNVETTQVVISFRPMNEEEQTVLQKSGMKIDSFKVAIDAVALIINPANPVDSLRTTQLDSVFRGYSKTWNQLGWKNNSIGIATCVPNQNSGVFEAVVTKILHGDKFGPVEQIIGTADSMIAYVEHHENAIGMISISNLRGNDQNVKMLALCDPNAPDSLGIKGLYFTPHQAHIARGFYPLSSNVYIYSRADYSTVGNGFIAFIASGPGQKIFLNNGLVPATMPVRLVQLTNKEITQ